MLEHFKGLLRREEDILYLKSNWNPVLLALFESHVLFSKGVKLTKR